MIPVESLLGHFQMVYVFVIHAIMGFAKILCIGFAAPDPITCAIVPIKVEYAAERVRAKIITEPY